MLFEIWTHKQSGPIHEAMCIAKRTEKQIETKFHDMTIGETRDLSATYEITRVA